MVGGGAQVAQVALGAVSEADRHNLRGERISVDTIPLVGEEHIAAAVRAVADLPRARLLVLAGSIMGGDISVAAEELRAVGIPIIALNMVGSITEHVDLVVSDPVQAGHDGRHGRRRHGRRSTSSASAAGATRAADVRIATWNVNSLKARQEAVEKWLERAAPDILLMQETKLTDADAPVMAFAMAGYQLVHHGEGRWNGVAIAARDGLAISDVVTNFGDGPVRDSGPGGAGAEAASEDDFDPFDEARMVAATVDGLRIVSLYAPNGRVVGSPFYAGKLAWFERLARWIREDADVGAPLVLGGDLNVAPTDIDVWDAAAVHGGTHVSEPERAAFRALLDVGPGRRVPIAAQRAGPLHVVGLPGRHVPQELRHAHRPPAGVAVGRVARGRPPRSTARRARARRSRPITPRWSSTSTSRASRSTPTGTAPWPASRRGPSHRSARRSAP